MTSAHGMLGDRQGEHDASLQTTLERNPLGARHGGPPAGAFPGDAVRLASARSGDLDPRGGGLVLFDFAFAGALLLGTGLLYELATRRAGHVAHRAAVSVALLAALLLVWINGAVGMIGSEGNPANLMYLGMLAVGLIGAWIARLEPGGMSRALFATALAQALVPVIALVAGSGPTLLADAFFVALWVVSAVLFRHSSVVSSPSR